MDTCNIRAGVYQFAAIDDQPVPCSASVTKPIHCRHAFLDQVFEEMPFSVQRIQTDRGTEFFAYEVQPRPVCRSLDLI